MIGVEVMGGCKRDRALAEDIVWFCLERLLPRHRALDITVTLRKTYEEGAWGFCYAGDEDRDLYIDVDHRLYREMGWEAFVDTLCHEMVHVMQTAKGLMVDRVRPKRLGYRKLWKGKDYSKTPYSKQPWERQAYRMQGPLLKKFKEAEEKG